MISEYLTRRKWKTLRASVRGPGHIRDNLPNQDCAFIGYSGKFLLAMVCDGLGSHAHSDYGSQALCRLFSPCFKEWSKVKPHVPTDFLRLLQCHWLMHTRSFGTDKCGSTCQLAIINSKGKGWLAQLGDGMALVRHGESVESFTEEKNGFGNETTAMGDYDATALWRMNKIELTSPGDRLLIMTDGISDDIPTEATKDFVSTFDKLFSLPSSNAQKELIDGLVHWRTPHHVDDKTIIAIERR